LRQHASETRLIQAWNELSERAMLDARRLTPAETTMPNMRSGIESNHHATMQTTQKPLFGLSYEFAFKRARS
jgi:hypothetical protein